MSSQATNLSKGEVSVGISDSLLVVASLTGFAILAATCYTIVITRLKSSDDIQKDGEIGHASDPSSLIDADVSKLNRAQRRLRAKVIMKEKRRACGTVLSDAAQGDDENNVDDHNPLERIDPLDTDAQLPSKATIRSRKERQQAAKAAEKRERQVLAEERHSEQLASQKDAQVRKRERRAASTLAAKQAKELSEQERENNWSIFLKTKIRIQTVSEFLEEAQLKRSVDVADIATSFGTSNTVILNRIKELVAMGRLAGVFQRSESRFVFVSENELEKIASYVEREGHVSSTELALVCTKTIHS